MSRFKRRVLISTAFILVIAVAVAGTLFVVTTRNALHRAEAFQFRRMLGARLGEQGLFRFFFATNRELRPGDDSLEDRFGDNRRPELHFGHFDTDIEPSLGVGMLINPSDWFQNEEIRVRSVRTLERERFVAALREQVGRSSDGTLLININGFRERFPSALRKTAFLAHVLDMDAAVIVFDWPGNQGGSPRGYRRAQRIARESGEDLAQVLRLVIEEVAPPRLALVANSMGGEVVVRAFAVLYQDRDFADAEPEFDDVVLTAPDVDNAEFGRQFKDQISALARDLTVYVSSNDRALLMSRVLNRGRRLGEAAINAENPDQTDEAARVVEMLEPGGRRVTLVDVTPVNRTRNFHNFSLETPEFFDDLYLRLDNSTTPRSRHQYQLDGPAGKEYTVLTRGR